jgi:hypothetical protein
MHNANLKENNKRLETLNKAVSLLQEGIIVEAGCFRGNEGDGDSTSFWGRTGRRIISIDNHPTSLTRARNRCGGNPNYTFIFGDSVAELSKLNERVALVYLDTLSPGNVGLVESQTHQVAEIGAVWSCLHPGSVVLLDDADCENGSKTALTEVYLKFRKAKPVMREYQAIYQIA